jgi:uncharacterized protein YidB (DUF937 family)
MSLFTSAISGALGEKPEGATDANALIALIGPLIAQAGGLQGLMNKFSQAGLGDIFSSWVNTGPNPPVSGEQIKQVLGSEQINALAAKLGINPAQVSQSVADHLPTAVDHLTPEGKIDPSTDIEQELAGLIPSLLQKFGGQAAQDGETQP